MRSAFQTLLVFVALSTISNQSFSQAKNLNNSKIKTETMNTASTTNKQLIRNLYEKVINQRHLELLNTVIDSSYTGIRGKKGVEGFKQTVGTLIEAFPDIQWHIEDLIADGNKVVVRWRWTGTFHNSFRGIAANQKQFANEAITIYEVVNNKAVKAWMQSDQLGFLIQAGIIPQSLIPGGPPKNK
jgi:predicted ester cyclase